MLRRLALASSLVALSAVSFAGKAHAQSVNVGFGGTVSTTCTFGTVTAGTFAVVPGTPTAIESSATVGTPGTVLVTCTAAANAAVANPVPNNAATTTLSAAGGYTAAAAVLDAAVPAQVAGSSTLTPALGRTTGLTKVAVPAGAARTLQVRMGASTTAAIPAGTYSYNAAVSIVP